MAAAQEISLKKMTEAYNKATYELPLDLYDKSIKIYDKLATRRFMRTGPLAAVTMPLSIMLRGWAKAAEMSTFNGRLSPLAIMGSLGGLGFGWWMAGSAAYAGLAVTAMAGVPTVITGIVAAAVTIPVIMPSMAIGAIAASLAFGALGLTFATMQAAANIHVGVRRSIDYFKGNRNNSYGETFSDDPPPPVATILPSLSEVEEKFSLKPAPKETAPVFNAEAATSLGSDITVKKIKLKAAPAASRSLSA